MKIIKKLIEMIKSWNEVVDDEIEIDFDKVDDYKEVDDMLIVKMKNGKCFCYYDDMGKIECNECEWIK